MPAKKSQIPLSLLKKNSLGSSYIEGSLPVIPDKRYFTIGEAADLCGVKPHVLRYWEQEFTQLKPSKRRGNRRYYQYKDVLVVRQIRKLLYEDGFTIEGARGQFSASFAETVKTTQDGAAIQNLITDLEDLLQKLKSPEKIT
jgi:DNA-binding transcriptional MerR regulator